MEGSSVNLVFETLEGLRLLVSYQNAQPPTDVEWDAWLAATDALWEKGSQFRMLVVSEGGHPSKAQIARVETTKRQQERIGGKERSEPVTAILSSSVAMRFVVSGVTLFNPRIRCYPLAARNAAYMHLSLSAAEASAAEAAIERLRMRLRAAPTVAHAVQRA